MIEDGKPEAMVQKRILWTNIWMLLDIIVTVGFFALCFEVTKTHIIRISYYISIVFLMEFLWNHPGLLAVQLPMQILNSLCFRGSGACIRLSRRANSAKCQKFVAANLYF